MASKDEVNDRTMDLPSWMSEENDHLHHKETEPLLFGTGALKLQDEERSVPAKQQYGSTTTETSTKKDEELGEADADLPVVKTVTKDTAQEQHDNDEPTSKDNKNEAKENTERKKEVDARETSPPPPSKRAAAASKQAKPNMKQPKPNRPKQQSTALSSHAARPHVPPQNPVLWVFHFINGSAVVSSLMLLTTQILPLFTGNASDQVATAFSILNLFLKFYIVLFCILFILVEVDVPISFIRESHLLQSYFSRGFLYSFLGLISTVEAYSDRVKSFLANVQADQQITWASIFMTVSAWIMCAIGLIYMCMGVCCLQRVRKQMKRDEQEAWRKYRLALRDWKQRREIYGDSHSGGSSSH